MYPAVALTTQRDWTVSSSRPTENLLELLDTHRCWSSCWSSWTPIEQGVLGTHPNIKRRALGHPSNTELFAKSPQEAFGHPSSDQQIRSKSRRGGSSDTHHAAKSGTRINRDAAKPGHPSIERSAPANGWQYRTPRNLNRYDVGWLSRTSMQVALQTGRDEHQVGRRGRLEITI
jgi:hypothetical protein